MMPARECAQQPLVLDRSPASPAGLALVILEMNSGSAISSLVCASATSKKTVRRG